MPIIIANALNITSDQVQTVALQAYQTGDEILTVYLAKIPSSLVNSLEAMLSAGNSPLYGQSGIEGQLSSTFVSTFSVTSYATDLSSSGSNLAADGSSASATGSVSTSNNSKTIIIATVVSCGLVLLAIAAYLAFRATKRGAIHLGSPRAGNSPRMGGGPDLRTFQLGAGRFGDRDSLSSTSTTSTGYSGSMDGGARHGASTSVDMNDRRSSFWRWSASSGGAGGSAGSPHEGMREGNRRVIVTRGADGQFDSSLIGR